MQTFLPFKDLQASLEVLDDKRLWKQAVEAKQILITLHRMRTTRPMVNPWPEPEKGKKPVPEMPNIPWSKHPAVLMWQGFDNLLAQYMDKALTLSERRGVNVDLNKFRECWELGMSQVNPTRTPPW